MLFIYPAIMYEKNDEEPYIVSLPDVNIVAEGDTMESAILDAKEQLGIYFRCVNKFGANLPKPTPLDQFKSSHPSDTILVVDAMMTEDEEDDDITIIF